MRTTLTGTQRAAGPPWCSVVPANEPSADVAVRSGTRSERRDRRRDADGGRVRLENESRIYYIPRMTNRSASSDGALVMDMAENENVAQIQQLYAALGRGDLPTVLGMFADDVDFQSPVTRSGTPEIPWSGARSTREEVAGFFAEMGGAVDVQPFEILDIFGSGDRVVVEARNRGTARATGRSFEHDWVMIFTIRGGRITRCYHYYDTADLVPALRRD